MLGVKITSHSSHSLLTDYQIVVYLVSRGKLQPAQKKFNHLASDYETTLDNASTIQQCSDSVSSQQVLDRVSGSAGDRPGRGSGRLNLLLLVQRYDDRWTDLASSCLL